MDTIFESYKKKRLSLVSPYFQFFSPSTFFPFPEIAVVIPSLNEFPFILKTLDSLLVSLLSCVSPQRIAVIVTVNNRISHSPAVKENNRLTLEALFAAQKHFSSVNSLLIAADFSSPGREIPENQGVGFSRKAGMDFALVSGAKLIACLDADTVCDPPYFTVLCEYLTNNTSKNGDAFFAGFTDFSHQTALNRRIDEHAVAYENALKTHSLKLRKCGTPYYPVALGPTLVCSAFAYASCGGMNCRLAGEDFYFLQSLIKLAPEKITRIPLFVHPASRFSDRVPFGTGKALLSANAGKSVFSAEFPDYCYVTLKKWIEVVSSSSTQTPVMVLMEQAEKISPFLRVFLERECFPAVWQKIAFNNRKNSTKLLRAFHVWFDALKIIRLFHFLQQTYEQK